MSDQKNYFWFSNLIITTESVTNGHYYYTPQWHSERNILLQVCFQDTNNKQEVSERMYDLVKDLRPSKVLAVNGYMAFSLASDIADSYPKGTCKVIHGVRPGNDFEVPDHFDPIRANDTVLIVDEGIITGTAVKQAVSWVISAGARPLRVVAAYSRYPSGTESLGQLLNVQTSVLGDFKEVYPIVQRGEKTCDACSELKMIDDQLNLWLNESDNTRLSKRKQALEPTWGYAQMWGQVYK